MKNVMFLLLWLITDAVMGQTLPPIPTAPNQRNAAGQHVGKWITIFNKNGQEPSQPDSTAFYRLMTFDEAGKVIGLTRVFYRSGAKMWEGHIAQLEPTLLIEGRCMWYYENGQLSQVAIFHNGKQQDTARTWYENGKPQVIRPMKDGLTEGLVQMWNVEGQERRLWFEHNEVVDPNLLNEQILDLFRQGKCAVAIPIALRVKQILSLTVGKEHPDYASALNNLGGLYEAMGQNYKSISLYEEALVITENSQGKDHLDYTITLTNLAVLYRAMEQYDKALNLLQQCQQIRARVLGKDHRDYAATISDLAELHYEMSRFDKALPMFQEALAIQEKTIGKDDPEYARTLNNFALLQKTFGQHDKALILLTQALTIFKKLAMKEHPAYATAINNLAELYKVMNQYHKALPLYQQALVTLAKIKGENHPDYAGVLDNMADLYSALNRYDKAIPLLIASRKKYKLHLLEQINMFNEQALESFQQRFNDPDRTFSLGYASRMRGLQGQHFNDALLSKGVGLLATHQLNNLLTKTQNTTTLKLAETLRITQLRIYQLQTQLLTRKAERDSLKQLANEQAQQLVLRLPEYGRAFDALRVEWQQVQAYLKPDEAAIEFVNFPYYHRRLKIIKGEKVWQRDFTDSTLYIAIMLRPGWKLPRMVVLGEQQQIDSLLEAGSASAEQINELYRGGRTGGYNNSQLTRGQQLSRLIWQPLNSLLKGVKTIVIAASGRLHQVALAALPNPADINQHTCMADRFQIRQVGSTRIVALRLPNKPLIPSTFDSYLYGGIIYDGDSLFLARQGHSTTESENWIAHREVNRSDIWTYLNGTRLEIDSLQHLLPKERTTTFSALSATEGSVKALSGRSPKVLHIATHGFFFQT